MMGGGPTLTPSSSLRAARRSVGGALRRPRELASASHRAVPPRPSSVPPGCTSRRWRGAASWLLACVGLMVLAGLGLIVAAHPWLGSGDAEAPEPQCTAQRAIHRTAEAEPPSELGEVDESPWSDAEQAVSSAPSVPKQTLVRPQGTMTIVDLGMAEPTLSAALREQQLRAVQQRQTMLVMLTGRRCRPCRGVDQALIDPAMQLALQGVRLVRLDLDVFREEIDSLGLPREVFPAFVLLGPELRPRDTIHGGEWGADVADNIAPVLGAFVRGHYDSRRYQSAPTSHSLRL